MGEVIRVGVAEFQSGLASFIEKVGQGQTVVVLADGREVGRFVPPAAGEAGERADVEERRPLPWGLLKGKVWIAPDFDDPLPDDVLDAFEAWEE